MPINRYYNPAQQQLLNTYVPLPFQELALAGQGKQKAQDLAQAGAISLGNKEFNYLGRDREKANQAYDWLENETSRLSSIDLTSREGKGELRNFLNEGKKRFGQRGDIGAMQKNYDTYQAMLKRERDRLAKGDITQDQFDRASKYVLENYQGVGDGSYGVYNPLSDLDIAKFTNVEDIVDKRAKDYKSDLIKKGYAYSDGKYIRNGVNGIEAVSEDDVYRDIYNSLVNDPQVMNYLGQSSQIGLISPEDIQTTIDVAARRGASKAGFRKEFSEANMKGDPYGLENYKGYLKKKDQVEAVGAIGLSEAKPSEYQQWKTNLPWYRQNATDKELASEFIGQKANTLIAQRKDLRQRLTDSGDDMQLAQRIGAQIQDINNSLTNLIPDNMINKAEKYMFEDFVSSTNKENLSDLANRILSETNSEDVRTALENYNEFGTSKREHDLRKALSYEAPNVNMTDYLGAVTDEAYYGKLTEAVRLNRDLATNYLDAIDTGTQSPQLNISSPQFQKVPEIQAIKTAMMNNPDWFVIEKKQPDGTYKKVNADFFSGNNFNIANVGLEADKNGEIQFQVNYIDPTRKALDPSQRRLAKLIGQDQVNPEEEFRVRSNSTNATELISNSLVKLGAEFGNPTLFSAGQRLTPENIKLNQKVNDALNSTPSGSKSEPITFNTNSGDKVEVTLERDPNTNRIKLDLSSGSQKVTHYTDAGNISDMLMYIKNSQ